MEIWLIPGKRRWKTALCTCVFMLFKWHAAAFLLNEQHEKRNWGEARNRNCLFSARRMPFYGSPGKIKKKTCVYVVLDWIFERIYAGNRPASGHFGGRRQGNGKSCIKQTIRSGRFDSPVSKFTNNTVGLQTKLCSQLIVYGKKSNRTYILECDGLCTTYLCCF